MTAGVEQGAGELYPAERLALAAEATADAGLGALLLTPGPDLRYLTWYSTHQSERLTCLAVPPKGPAYLLAPTLAFTPGHWFRVGTMNLETTTSDETDDPYRIVARRLAGLSSAGLAEQMWALMVLRFRNALPGTRLAL